MRRDKFLLATSLAALGAPLALRRALAKGPGGEGAPRIDAWLEVAEGTWPERPPVRWNCRCVLYQPDLHLFAIEDLRGRIVAYSVDGINWSARS